jgi:restriction endonuclease S subunit
VTPVEIAGGQKSALVIGPFGSSLKTSDYCDSGVPLIFVRDIRSADFTTPRAYVSDSKADELRAHVALPGDVLVTKMGEPPGDACVYTGDVPAIITADCIRLRPSADFDARYVVHALRSRVVRRQVRSITSGAAQQKVSLDRFRTRLEIAAPPLAEQRRIAAIFDRADTLGAASDKCLRLLDNLGIAIFYEMFGDPNDNPMGWPRYSFNGVMRDSSAGSARVPAWQFNASGSLPIVDQGVQLVAGYTDDASAACHAPLPVVVFGDHTRAVKFVDFQFAIGADGVKVLVPQPRVNASYLAMLLKVAPVSSLGYSRHMRALKAMTFPVPPRELQDVFAARLGTLRRQVLEQLSVASLLAELHGSLSARTFCETTR